MTDSNDKQADIERRKLDHLSFFKEGGVEAQSQTTWLEYVRPIHQALPELNLEEIDTGTRFAGREFKAPLFITGMTGGASEAAEINRTLARVAEDFGIGFGLGSQRAMLEHPELAATYQVRESAPKVFLAGNIGAAQILDPPLERIRDMLESVGADALCIHLNPAQELAQPEGDTEFKGVLEGIRILLEFLDVPVIVKEVGAGLSRETVRQLKHVGVRSIDISGCGGTSWVGVELKRHRIRPDAERLSFWDWGLPTAAALSDLEDSGMEILASGGLRTGMDAARAIMLGADLAGMASPMIQAYYAGGEAGCRAALQGILDSLRKVMLLTGCRSVSALKDAPHVILGPLREWREQRGGWNR